MKKVMCAMSGGVDSSVSALILKQKGYEVVGVTMCLGIQAVGEHEPSCCNPQAIQDAKNVCLKLDIPHYVFDHSKDLNELVIQPFIKDYKEGRTPNPCVLCNQKLKFGTLLDKAGAMGFDSIATGHYAEIRQEKGRYQLIRGSDIKKDQSYFLYGISYDHLEKIIFPIHHMDKSETRELALKHDLPVHAKKDSYDVCFIPDQNIKSFLKRNMDKIDPGPILDINGSQIGTHEGVVFYTIGQRKGLNVAAKTRLYVIDIDVVSNSITLGEKKYLEKSKIKVSDMNWLTEKRPQQTTCQIRYAQTPVSCQLNYLGDSVEVKFEKPLTGIACGQSAVFYENDQVLGGGIISDTRCE